MIDVAYIGVLFLGLLHGLEPGHGWPVAVIYSIRKKQPLFNATISSGIIGMAHLVSSIAVVVVYVLLRNYFDFTAPWLKYLAAGILLVITVRLWLEKTSGLEDQHDHLHADQRETEHAHEHEHAGDEIHIHPHKHGVMATMSLRGLASFAFILGFAHEEEFALLALTAGGVNAWLMMIIYGLAVLTGLVIVTVVCVKLFSYFQSRLIRYEKYVPKISAIIVLLMAVIIAIG